MKATQFTAMLLFSLVTGVFWVTWFSLSRSIGAITPATFLEVGHTMIGNLEGPMSVLMPAALLSALVLAAVLFRRRRRRCRPTGAPFAIGGCSITAFVLSCRSWLWRVSSPARC